MDCKIAIVEDEIIIARNIQKLVISLGYEFLWFAINYQEAKQKIEEQKPDLVFLDIKLNGAELDGIDLGHLIQERFKIPFIYLTANSDIATIDKAKTTFPLAFLTKPINKSAIYSSVEITWMQYIQEQNATFSKSAINDPSDICFLKDGYLKRRINRNEILYIKSENVYITIYFEGNKTITLRNTLDKFLEEFAWDKLIKIHRSYSININKIVSFDAHFVTIQNIQLPISRNYRAALTKL